MAKKNTKIMYNTLHRKLKILQHDLGMNSCDPEGQAVPAPIVAPDV